MKAPKMPSVEYEAETKTKTNCNAGSVEGRADFESVLTHRYRRQQVEFFETKLADSTVCANNVTPDDPIHSQLSISTALTTTSVSSTTTTSSTLLLEPTTNLGRVQQQQQLQQQQQENTRHTRNTHLGSDTYFMLQAPKMVPFWVLPVYGSKWKSLARK